MNNNVGTIIIGTIIILLTKQFHGSHIHIACAPLTPRPSRVVHPCSWGASATIFSAGARWRMVFSETCPKLGSDCVHPTAYIQYMYIMCMYIYIYIYMYYMYIIIYIRETLFRTKLETILAISRGPPCIPPTFFQLGFRNQGL